MKPLLFALFFAFQPVALCADGLTIYPPVPGLAASEHYQVRIRSAREGSEWQSAFAWETVCKTFEKRTDGYLSGILFQNISIAAPSVLGEPQIHWGQASARIRNLTFENLTLAGKPVRDPAFFKTNGFVEDLIFAPSTGSKPWMR